MPSPHPTLSRRLMLSSALAAASLAPFRVLAADPLVPQATDATPRLHHVRKDRPLPDAQVARGRKNLAGAWLSDPVTRYPFHPFASAYEAGLLWVETSNRRNWRLEMTPDSVIADREPRLVDVDGDGQDEVVFVRAHLKSGASLAIAALQDGVLAIKAETPPLGLPSAWLNPSGVGNFSGSGPMIAFVANPHQDGELQMWRLGQRGLEQIYAAGNVSNHEKASAEQRLYCVADFAGLGVPQLAIPSGDRRSLRFLSFAPGRTRELKRIDLPAPAARNFELVEQNGRLAVSIGYNGDRRGVFSLAS